MAWIEEIEEANSIWAKSENKPYVCCNTCHRERKHECQFKADCYRETRAFLWWNKELGYFPKIQEKYSFAFWEPPIEGFITRKEFSV